MLRAKSTLLKKQLVMIALMLLKLTMMKNTRNQVFLLRLTCLVWNLGHTGLQSRRRKKIV
ncbi:hypothetical protein RR51_25745 [Pseudomonas sp. C5pp]|nr:hypothetical protein RR51_25745 [Pseudomonas sp. C5pp]